MMFRYSEVAFHCPFKRGDCLRYGLLFCYKVLLLQVDSLQIEVDALTGLLLIFEVEGWLEMVGCCESEHWRCKPSGGSGGILPQKILKSGGTEMLFPAFPKRCFPLKREPISGIKYSYPIIISQHLTEFMFTTSSCNS